jgi:hypothetical protein
MKSITNYIILFFILIVLGILHKKFEEKRMREENKDSSEAIQNYLLDDVTLGKSKKPILWLHIPYEYNSRKWLSFGSRSSFDLNQPYLYLTVRSIIKNCDQSFTICIIDDNSFEKLLPGWSVDMSKISSPISDNMRKLGLMKLIHKYGGVNCPISFLCMKDLTGLYQKGTRGGKMFLCENNDKNVTSATFDFYPDLNFCGAPKNNEVVGEFIDFIQRIMSRDFTAQSQFLGDFDRFANKKIQNGKINMIPGIDVGIKTIDDKPIKLEDLMSNNYLNIYPQTYGIWIPSEQILSRRKYEWFARLSQKQVLESETILGNYFLVNLGDGGANILEPLKVKPDWVGFWKTPLYPGLYMVSQPNMLGDNVPRVPYTGR